MSKTTASAAGGAMPADDHPDAALFISGRGVHRRRSASAMKRSIG